ncbi:MAG: STAS domain-containing protein [Candidatus Acidiferrales bacterium]
MIPRPTSDTLAKGEKGRVVDIKLRRAGNGIIIDLAGALKLGEAELAFREHVHQLVDSGELHVAVNLAGVTELDSSGIGALVRAFTLLKQAGGKCTYFAAPRRVQLILKTVRLDSVLAVAADEDAALARM